MRSSLRSAGRVAAVAFLLVGGASCGGGGGGGPATPVFVPLAAPFAPVVGGSAPGPLAANTSFQLQASAFELNGQAMTFAWTLLSAPVGAAPSISSPALLNTNVTGALPAGTYEFQLVVSDGALSTTIIVPVTLPPAPAAPVATLFTNDRMLVPLAGSVQVTAGAAVGPFFVPPQNHTAYEGGWSGMSRVRDSLGGHVSDDFWIVNDRGPNYGISLRVPPFPPASTAFGAGAKLFPLAGYQQKIQRVRVNRATGAVDVLSSTGIRDRGGLAVNGLPSNVVGMTTTETAYSNLDDKTSLLAKSPQGFDFEGLYEDRLTIAGVERMVFWTGDEYGPSIQMLEADPVSPNFGRIEREYIPGATPAAGLFALPAVLRTRRDNRGFEGVAVTKAAVWGMVQSTFNSATTGNASTRLHRLVRVDKATNVVTMYGYDHIANPASFGTTHNNVKVGDMVALSESEFLVLEHDGNFYAHVYRIRLAGAATVLTEGNGFTYETGTVPYVPVEKTLVLDLGPHMAAFSAPDKPEGMVLTDPSTLMFTFDNDYAFASDETNTFPKDANTSRNLLLEVKLAEPLLPSLHFIAEFATGLTGANGEIVDVEASTGRAFLTCDTDQAVYVFNGQAPGVPAFVRRDALANGNATSVAAHPSFGYYLVAIREGGAGGNDVLQVHSTSTGALLRSFDLGAGRGPDAVRISPDGRWALLCNEAEDFWRPGSVMVFDLGTNPNLTPLGAALAIGAPTHIGLDGLVPATGAFSTRFVDRLYNKPFPAGLLVTTANGPVTIVDGETRATDPMNPLPAGLPTDTVVTFTFGAVVVTARYKFDGVVSGGNDGNVFVFQLGTTALSLEPEIAAFDADSTLAVVSLQENNAVVVIDLTAVPPAVRAVNGCYGLGLVNYLDCDKRRRDPTPTSPAKFIQPLNNEREADGVSVLELGGVPCFVTADEGDTYGPAFNTSSDNRQRGGRTLSIFRLADGALLGDTGNALDFWTNITGRWGAFVEDSRARRGGCEPENLDTTAFGDRSLAVVGLERAHAVALVDVTNPGLPSVLDVQGIGGLTIAGARTAPEGIKIVHTGGRTFVLVAFEASGRVGIFEIR